MLKGDSTRTYTVNDLTKAEEDAIKTYLGQLVQTWCSQHGNEWFYAHNLIGEKKIEWEDTPLNALLAKHSNSGKSTDEAESQAAIDAGHLLKQLLDEDQTNTFETQRDHIARKYRLL